MWNWLKSSKDQPAKQTHNQAPAQPDIPVETTRCRMIVITGSSGAGRKRTAKKLSEELGIPYVLPYTTRSIRPNERNGEHYRFLSAEEFRAMEERQAFFQTVRLERGSYGIAAEDLQLALSAHKAAIVVVNREGAQAFRNHYGNEAQRIFLYVTRDDIRLRLERESAPPEVLEEYLRNYEDQIIHKKESEFLLQNMDPEVTVRKIVDFLKDKL